MVGNITYLMIFAVFDPSPLTLWINCSFLYLYIYNRQIGVGDSKYGIVFDPLLTGHVIWRMRSGRVRIFNGNQWETL